DNYPKNGANYSQDKLVRVYEIHLKHKIVKQPEKSTVKEVIHYLYDNGHLAKPVYESVLNFSRMVGIDQVTGKNTMEFGKQLKVQVLRRLFLLR
ncbi:hypothetical protein NMR19_00865, partial [Pediococcus pentosaceus]